MATLTEQLRASIKGEWPANHKGISLRGIHVAENAKADPQGGGKQLRKIKDELNSLVNAHAKADVALFEKATQWQNPRHAALVPAMLARLARMSVGEVWGLALKDESVARIVLESPEWLTGITGENRRQLENGFAARVFPDEAKALADNKAAIDHASECVKAATVSLANALNIDARSFTGWLDKGAPLPQEAAAARDAKLAAELAAINAPAA